MKACLFVILALLPAAALSAEPRTPAATPSSPPRIAVWGLTPIQIPQELADFYGEHFAQQLAFQGLTVVTRKEISTLLGMERQRQLLGCEESSSCTTELAGALGADGVAMGSVARVGKDLHLSVRIVANDAAVLASFSAKVQGEELTLATLSQAAAAMAPEVARKSGKPLGQKRVVQSEGGPRAWAWAPATVGALGLAGGTFFLLQAKGAHDRLTSNNATPMPYADAEALKRSGESQQLLGLGGLGVAVVGAAAAGALLLMGGTSSQVQGSVALAPGGAGLAIGGTFP